jgi:hypothetical protein
MAYTGGIDYLDVSFGGVEWTDLQSPWSRTSHNAAYTVDEKAHITLTAKAQGYKISAPTRDEISLVMDTPGGTEQIETMCVVLGRVKGPIPTEDKRHYILLVRPVSGVSRDGRSVYQRCGAGYLPGRCIAQPTLEISIA